MSGEVDVDDAEEEEEEEEEVLDDYLRPPAMHRRQWQPLLTYVEVTGLPRGAAVEYQPLAYTCAGSDTETIGGWKSAPLMAKRGIHTCLFIAFVDCCSLAS